MGGEFEIEYIEETPIAIESLISIYLQLIERLDATERVVQRLVELAWPDEDKDGPPTEVEGWQELMRLVRERS